MVQVTHPLCDRSMISARLDAVSEIAEFIGSCKFEANYLLSSVLTNLGRSPDIQRGITRIFHQTATPSEVLTDYCSLFFPFIFYFLFCLPTYLYTRKWERELLQELINLVHASMVKLFSMEV